MKEVLNLFKNGQDKTLGGEEIIFNDANASGKKRYFRDMLRGAFYGRKINEEPETDLGAEAKVATSVESLPEKGEPEIERSNPLKEIFKRYNISEEVTKNEQIAVFVGQLRREIVAGDRDVWISIKDKKIADLNGSKKYDLEDMDKLVNKERLDGIVRVEKDYISILGEKAKIQEDETIEEWTRRIVEISFKADK